MLQIIDQELEEKYSNAPLINIKDCHHLFLSPLCPGVPCEGDGKAKEGESHQQPKKAVEVAELSIGDVADPMD